MRVYPPVCLVAMLVVRPRVLAAEAARALPRGLAGEFGFFAKDRAAAFRRFMSPMSDIREPNWLYDSSVLTF